MAIAAALLAIIIIAIQGRFALTLRQIAHTSITGLLLHGAYLGGCFYAVSRGVPAGIVALIVSTQPILVACAGALFLGEKLHRRVLIGLILGGCGVALVLAPRITSHSAAHLSAAGIAACLIAALGGASGTMAQKRFAQEEYPLESAMYQYIATGVATYLLSLLLGEGPVTWSPTFIAALAWLVLALSLGAILILFSLLKKGSASSVSSLYYLVPPTTAVMSFLLFGEPITVLLIIGMAITISGVYLVIKKPAN